MREFPMFFCRVDIFSSFLNCCSGFLLVFCCRGGFVKCPAHFFQNSGLLQVWASERPAGWMTCGRLLLGGASPGSQARAHVHALQVTRAHTRTPTRSPAQTLPFTPTHANTHNTRTHASEHTRAGAVSGRDAHGHISLPFLAKRLNFRCFFVELTFFRVF